MNRTVERTRRSYRDTAWAWLVLGPALVALCGVGLGLLLVSLRHSNSLLADPQPQRGSSGADASAPGANYAPGTTFPNATPAPQVATAGAQAANGGPHATAGQAPLGGRKLSLELLVGKWSGRTEADGVLDITVVAEGRLAYSFSDGCRERDQGRIVIREHTIYYFEDGERRPAVWWGFLDGVGQLHLQMDDDEEIYVLAREK